jgi:DMSO/TMAO reductase YedYZ molybdopterin-dependent catalytic subunit
MNSLFGRKEDEINYRKEGRMPPGQAMTKKFPVLHYGPVPRFDPESWTFKVWGEVEEPVSFTWAEFQGLPRTQVHMDLHCVTAWSKFDTVWEGVSVRSLVESGIIRLLPSVRFVLQHAEYGYTTNLPLDVVLQENFLLATHYNGEPIAPDHGYPLRGVVGAIPDRRDLKTPYLWKGAKWLRGLEILTEDKPGFWERAGYHNEADIWKEQRFG